MESSEERLELKKGQRHPNCGGRFRVCRACFDCIGVTPYIKCPEPSDEYQKLMKVTK